jgi:phosphoribosylanthranilate isomerase
VPPFVSRVLVTHLESASAIVALADEVEVDVIQIHGLVSDQTVRDVVACAAGRRIVRALHVTTDVTKDEVVDQAIKAAAYCDAVLMDSRTVDRLGGTGLTHDWSISAAVRRALSEQKRPVILAGGLKPSNIRDAIAVVRPYAVDANSGLEDARGNKVASACTEFVSLAHGDEPVTPGF